MLHFDRCPRCSARISSLARRCSDCGAGVAVHRSGVSAETARTIFGIVALTSVTGAIWLFGGLHKATDGEFGIAPVAPAEVQAPEAGPADDGAETFAGNLRFLQD